MLTGRKLLFTLAFGVFLVLAFGAGCNGFFVDPKLTTITITPTTPQLVIGDQPKKMTATGTYDNSDTKDLSGSVSWSMDPNGFATIDNLGNIKGTTATTTAVTLTAAQGAISGQTTFTVVPVTVTSITVTPSSGVTTTTGSQFHLKAVDQLGNDISGSVTWTFTLHQTSTVETGITRGTPDASGQVFTVGTLSPAVGSFPVTLDAVASVTTSTTTVTSVAVTVTITS